MAETGGFWIADGEDAGSTPWEFTQGITQTGTCTIALDETAKNNGTYGYKVHFDGTTRTAYGKKSFTAADDLYVRSYIYVPTAFTLAENANLTILHFLKGGGTDLIVLNLYGGAAGAIGLRMLDDVAVVYANSSCLSRNAWHYIEARFLVNASTGGGALYLDSTTPLATNLDHNTSATQPDNLRIGATDMYSSIPAANDYFYLDDIKASLTGPIGAYAGGTPTIITADGPQIEKTVQIDPAILRPRLIVPSLMQAVAVQNAPVPAGVQDYFIPHVHKKMIFGL